MADTMKPKKFKLFLQQQPGANSKTRNMSPITTQL